MATPFNIESSINRLYQLLGSDSFDETRFDDGTCETAFVEVIELLDHLLQQSEASGKRIDFTKEVGVNGKIQDITSLVSSLRQSIQLVSDKKSPLGAGYFNCYHNAGTGYFANGFFFTADYDNEVAFFVYDQRIYLNRHIKRSVMEADRQLATLNRSISSL